MKLLWKQTSSTQAMLSFENTSGYNLNDTVSFNLYGIDGTMKHISSKINFGSGNQDMDLDPLKPRSIIFQAKQVYRHIYLMTNKQLL